MKKIVVGGQVEKDLLKKLIEKYGEAKVEVEVLNDIDAAMGVQSGKYEYYFGACNTGGGGALAMAIAILGADKCTTINSRDEEAIKAVYQDNKVAFGFTPQYAEDVIKVIISEIIK